MLAFEDSTFGLFRIRHQLSDISKISNFGLPILNFQGIDTWCKMIIQ